MTRVYPRPNRSERSCRESPADTSQRPMSKAGAAVPASSQSMVRGQTAHTEAYLRALAPPDVTDNLFRRGAYNVGAQLIANETSVDAIRPGRASISKTAPG